MKRSTSKPFLLISIGILFNSLVFFISRKVQMPDFLSGALMGLGIGLMMLGLKRSRAKAANC